MNAFNLKNNALFLACWHERNRPVQMVCSIILLTGILFLSFLTISANKTEGQNIWQAFFYVVATIQALVLLGLGSFFAGSLSARERTSETLDFHRNSPQPVLEKVIGLVLGSTCFEWLIFAIFILVELPFTFLTKITLRDILLFNLSLVLTGILCHTSAVTISLLSSPRKRGSPFLFLFLLIYLSGPLVGLLMHIESSNNFCIYLFGFVALKYIVPISPTGFSGYFYTFNIPLILLQSIVQIPIILLMVKGIERIFSRPNSPAWSKQNVICFCSFVFFIATGLFVADYTHFHEIFATRWVYSLRSFLIESTTMFILLFSTIGFFVSGFCVPSYFKCSKYIILNKNKPNGFRNLFDDGATSLPTILICLAIGAVSMLPYFFLQKIPVLTACVVLIMLSSHITAFAGFLEFFRLSRLRTNKIFFFTVLMVWWVFIPWLISTVHSFEPYPLTKNYSLSPFGGSAYVFDIIISEKPLSLFPLLAPCLATVVAWLLALQEHRVIRQRVKT